MKHQPGDVLEYQPKEYFSKDRAIGWGKDLTRRQMKALRKGEVFKLLNKDGVPFKTILMDSYNMLREKAI